MKLRLFLLLSLLVLAACAPVNVSIPEPTNPIVGQACLGAFLVDNANPRGARITDLSPGGPLELARVRVNDVIVAINGYATPSVEYVRIELMRYRPGEVVSVRHARERLYGLYWDYYNTRVRLGENRQGICVAQ